MESMFTLEFFLKGSLGNVTSTRSEPHVKLSLALTNTVWLVCIIFCVLKCPLNARAFKYNQ